MRIEPRHSCTTFLGKSEQKKQIEPRHSCTTFLGKTEQKKQIEPRHSCTTFLGKSEQKSKQLWPQLMKLVKKDEDRARTILHNVSHQLIRVQSGKTYHS